MLPFLESSDGENSAEVGEIEFAANSGVPFLSSSDFLPSASTTSSAFAGFSLAFSNLDTVVSETTTSFAIFKMSVFDLVLSQSVMMRIALTNTDQLISSKSGTLNKSYVHACVWTCVLMGKISTLPLPTTLEAFQEDLSDWDRPYHHRHS